VRQIIKEGKENLYRKLVCDSYGMFVGYYFCIMYTVSYFYLEYSLQSDRKVLPFVSDY